VEGTGGVNIVGKIQQLLGKGHTDSSRGVPTHRLHNGGIGKRWIFRSDQSRRRARMKGLGRQDVCPCNGKVIFLAERDLFLGVKLLGNIVQKRCRPHF
jgi:hypothetical protein